MSLMGAAAIAGGAQLAGGALGQLMARRGMSKGQWRDHERMQGMQIEGSKQLTDYQNQKQLEMWKATGPEAQRQQLENAGLSASLMYGGAGAGGQTVGGGGAAAPNTGPVESDSSRMMASAQMASTMADVALKTAQAKNIEADTENKAKEGEGIGLDNIAKTFQNAILKASQEDQISVIKATKDKLTAESNEAAARGAVAQATQEAEIKRINQEAINAGLEAELKKSGTQVNKATLNKIAEEINQGWDRLENERRGQDIDAETAREMMKTILISSGIQAGGNLLNNLIEIRSGKFIKNIGGK